MKRLADRGKLIREGERQISDPTDPDYEDKKIARLVADYKQLDKMWRTWFLNTLPSHERRVLLDVLGLVKK